MSVRSSEKRILRVSKTPMKTHTGVTNRRANKTIEEERQRERDREGERERGEEEKKMEKEKKKEQQRGTVCRLESTELNLENKNTKFALNRTRREKVLPPLRSITTPPPPPPSPPPPPPPSLHLPLSLPPPSSLSLAEGEERREKPEQCCHWRVFPVARRREKKSPAQSFFNHTYIEREEEV